VDGAVMEQLIDLFDEDPGDKIRQAR